MGRERCERRGDEGKGKKGDEKMEQRNEGGKEGRREGGRDRETGRLPYQQQPQHAFLVVVAGQLN